MTRPVMLASGDPADMTLGEAIDHLSREDYWCACPGGSPSCVRKADALKRGAHIVVRLLADAQRLERGKARQPEQP